MGTRHAIVALTVSIFALLALPAAADLLINPGFEFGMASWGQAWASPLALVVDSSVHHSGTNSIKITGDGTTNRGGILQTVPILASATTYTLSGWIKSQGLAPGWSASLSVEFTAADGTWLGIIGGNPVCTTADWQYDSITFTVPQGTANILVEDFLKDSQGLGQVNSGTAWFDDMSLVPNELLNNPGFESGLASWGQVWASPLALVVDSSVRHSGTDSLKITGDGTTNRGGVQQVVHVLSDVTTYTLSGWIKTQDLAPGWAGLLMAEFTAADGTWLGIVGCNPVYSTSDWQYGSVTFTVPTGTANILVEGMLRDNEGLGQVNSGTAWFDDMSLSPPTTITGKVSLPDYIGDITGVGAAIEVRGTAGTQVFRALLGASGSFVLSGVNVGTYDIAVKVCGYIRALKSGIIVSQPTDVGTIPLACGDVDGDNYIGSVDHSIVSSMQSSTPHP